MWSCVPPVVACAKHAVEMFASTTILRPLAITPRTDGPYSFVSCIPQLVGGTFVPAMTGHDAEIAAQNQFHRRLCMITWETGACASSTPSRLDWAWMTCFHAAGIAVVSTVAFV